MDFSLKFISLVLLLLIISNRCSCAEEKPKWGANFSENYLVLRICEHRELTLDLWNLNKTGLMESSAEIRVVSDSPELWVDKKIPVSDIENDQWHGTIKMDALFLGSANIFVEIDWKTQNKSCVERSYEYVYVQIIRRSPPLWIYSEYYDIYETSLYIITRCMLGMVLKWHEVTDILQNPLCIVVSLLCTVLIMPMVSVHNNAVIFLKNNNFVLFFTK